MDKKAHVKVNRQNRAKHISWPVSLKRGITPITGIYLSHCTVLWILFGGGGGDLSSTFNLFKKKKQIFVIEKIMIIELRASRVKVWGYFTILVKYQLHM